MKTFGSPLQSRLLRSFSRMTVPLALSVVLVFSLVASAHERRKAGTHTMVVGWAEEPAFSGFKNAVQVVITDSQDKPVTDLGDDLKVEVIFGNEKRGPLALDPAFGPRFGRQGEYQAPLIPTRPGNYTFHFVGEIKGQKVDASFTSSDDTFDPVRESADAEFPVKDPSRAELSGFVERVGMRLDTTRSTANSARFLSIVAIIVGAVALIAAVGGRRSSVRAR